MADTLCTRCGHPQAEHIEEGCTHLDDLGPQPHGNPERGLCTCDGFKEAAVPIRTPYKGRAANPSRGKHTKVVGGHKASAKRFRKKPPARKRGLKR